MSFRTIVACAGLGAILSTPIVLQGGDAPPPHVATGPWSSARLDRLEILTAEFVPSAPGGAGSVAVPVSETSTREPSGREALGATRPDTTRIQADRATIAILGDVLDDEVGFELERSSRRNVIEHVIAGTVPFGIVSAEPSDTERELGARDIPLGDFEPCIVIDWSNRFRHLTRRDAQNILSGRGEYWPGTQDPVQVFTPAPGERALLLTELMIPGDTFAAAVWKDDIDELLASVRGERLACGVAHRAVVGDDLGVLEIEGFRPKLTLRAVFRDENADEVRALLEFWRSPKGKQRLGRRLTMR